VPHFETWYKSHRWFWNYLSLLCFIAIGECAGTAVYAQSCPVNIDFETGTFANWTCWLGRTSAVGDQNVISLNKISGPVNGHHTMYSNNNSQVDPFGGFPVLCPNGSGHSIRLGSTEAGGQAEGVSYDFTVPANSNSYSVTFHYAVVFQSPNHRINEQPRMEVEVTNVTDNSIINCGSFSFIAIGSSLPGFQVSNVVDTITVLYKKWSTVTVDLSGNAGKQIRLFFKTADCTFRRHFGYAYIDVDSDCGGSFVGAAFCKGDSVVHVTGPAGYAGYTWYDSALTTVLGKGPTLILKPPPVSGTSISLKLDPYDGYGCTKVLLALLKDTLQLSADAGNDALYCHTAGVSIGSPPRQELIYSWSPAAGLSNPEISNPIAAPDATTTYTLTASSVGGGCKTSDAVVIKSSAVDTTLRLAGKPAFCFGYGDSAVLKITPTQHIEWYRDNGAMDATGITAYNVAESGTYYAVLQNSDGCTLSTSKQTILIEQPVPPVTYPVKYAIINLTLPLEARHIGNQVLWKPAIWLDNPASYTPNFTSATEQLYAIEMHTAAGCVTVDTQLVKTVKNVEIYVPSGFTPNGDGNNDILRPVLRGVKGITYFRIFNRAGNLLFETNVERLGWNGIFKGVPQDPQTLVWMLECTGVDGYIFQRKGTTVLLR
jgi:gliding motility-associated-like protein